MSSSKGVVGENLYVPAGLETEALFEMLPVPM